jgi:hypothetical protein
MRDRPGAGTRLGLVGLGVLTLLAVVALASRGDLGGGGLGGPAPSGTLLDYSFSIFLVAYVLAIPFVIYSVWFRRRTLGQSQRGKRRWGTNILGFAAFLVIALAISEFRHSHGSLQRLRPPPSLTGTGTTTTGLETPREPTFQWLVVVVTTAIALGAIGAWWWARRRRTALRTPLLLGEELVLALDDAIDDVRGETDPRRAVIKAYARMEAILGAHGLPRHPAEAPYEYLARTLQELDASGASVTRLTALFERAKFSLHEIAPEMREDAIEALTAVRDELRNPERETVPA